MIVVKSLIKILKLIDQQGFNAFNTIVKGYSISSHQILDNIAMHCNSFETIIDVGANQGQFAIASSRKFPKAKIISFEPLPEVYEKFKINIKNNKRITGYNTALGNEKGIIDFYKNEHSHASSALVISEEQKTAIPKTSKTTKVQVKIDRLDSILNTIELTDPVLLKLDVQGYEKNVLEGATHLLPKIDYLVFEASFISMYKGEPLFDEMHTFLKNTGFELIAPVGFLEGDNGMILQLDFLYKNKHKSD